MTLKKPAGGRQVLWTPKALVRRLNACNICNVNFVMIWYRMVQYSSRVWYAMVWCGIVCYGMAGYGTVQYNMVSMHVQSCTCVYYMYIRISHVHLHTCMYILVQMNPWIYQPVYLPILSDHILQKFLPYLVLSYLDLSHRILSLLVSIYFFLSYPYQALRLCFLVCWEARKSTKPHLFIFSDPHNCS